MQCRLQALVGSSGIAHGMLHWCFSRIFSCLPHAKKLASTSIVLIRSLRTSGLRFITRMISWYMLLPGSAITLAKALRACEGNSESGHIAFTFSTTLPMLLSGSSHR